MDFSKVSFSILGDLNCFIAILYLNLFVGCLELNKKKIAWWLLAGPIDTPPFFFLWGRRMFLLTYKGQEPQTCFVPFFPLPDSLSDTLMDTILAYLHQNRWSGPGRPVSLYWLLCICIEDGSLCTSLRMTGRKFAVNASKKAAWTQ